ncbi:Uncharacterised protein [uncultured archaeon]|nr:Uncharacterised protein [uncultured archaeon]
MAATMIFCGTRPFNALISAAPKWLCSCRRSALVSRESRTASSRSWGEITATLLTNTGTFSINALAALTEMQRRERSISTTKPTASAPAARA